MVANSWWTVTAPCSDVPSGRIGEIAGSDKMQCSSTASTLRAAILLRKKGKATVKSKKCEDYWKYVTNPVRAAVPILRYLSVARATKPSAVQPDQPLADRILCELRNIVQVQLLHDVPP